MPYFQCVECPYVTTNPDHMDEHFWEKGHDYNEVDEC